MQGERLGSYLIDRELGSGGMGKVYAATVVGRAPGLSAGDRVALKLVHPHLLETDGFFMRFMREAQLGASIQHANVVRTLMADADVADGASRHFLVMEYVEGQTLGALLRELDRVPEELCRHVAREICKGLGAIHDAGVVHRDLKPENVLITQEHVVKVMDLGIARLADEALRLSQTGAFVGSVEYAAPEQFEGGDLDARCDLHALGILLYELSSGQHPYRGDGLRGVMKRVCEEPPRRLGEVNPQLSASFEEIVHTLLAKSPEDRFASAAELLAILEEGDDSVWWKQRALAIRAETDRPLRRIRIPRETAVYGREPEIDELCALYHTARSGAGQVVLIEGEAGIGKSRLVDELIGRLQRRGEDFNFLFGSYPPGGAATASGAFSTAYREHFGEAGSGAYLAPTPILVPAFDALLSGECAPTGVELLTKDSLQTCFVNVTRALAAERVTIVLIDDLHFAPDEGRALFTSLAMAVPGQRVLLLGTTRRGAPDNWVAGLTRLPQTTHVPLARLGPKDLARLLADSFKSEQLAHSLGVQVGLKSDGNPFFAFEIIRGLREGDFITQTSEGSWVSSQIIDEIEIPSSVLDLVNARVSGLSEAERDVLDVACCFGFEFDPLTVGEVLGLGRIPVLKCLGQIERQHRLVRASGRRYVFDHHQVQEALYRSLSELLREEYHGAIATALESRNGAAEKAAETLDGALCVDLCEHFLRGANGESALRYLGAAEAHLTKAYQRAQVADLNERALAVPGLLAGKPRVKTLLRLCGVNSSLDGLSRRARQEECAREAEALADELDADELRWETANAIGWCVHRSSRHAEAEVAFRRALDIAIRRGDLRAEAGATGNLGLACQAQGRVDEALAHHERYLALSRELGRREGEAIALGNLGLVLRSLGRLDEALECHEQSLAIELERGNRAGVASDTANISLVLKSLGRLVEAREHAERSLSLSRECGNRLAEATARGSLANVFTAEGRLTEAREHLESQLALCREIGDREGAGVAQHNLGHVLRETGEREDAEKRFTQCLQQCAEIGFRHLAAATHLMLGSLRGASGGQPSLAAACDLAHELGAPGWETLARCELALLPGGDAQDAVAAFTANEARLEAEERLEARYLLWRATGERAHLEEAKRLLDEAVAHVDDTTRHSMLTNLRVNRAITAAWNRDQSGDEHDDDDDDNGDEDNGDDKRRGSEAVTRAG